MTVKKGKKHSLRSNGLLIFIDLMDTKVKVFFKIHSQYVFAALLHVNLNKLFAENHARVDNCLKI